MPSELRPPLAPCTCVWPKAHAYRTERAVGDVRKDERVESMRDPLRSSLPLVPEIVQRAFVSPGPVEVFSTPGDLLSTAGARDDDLADLKAALARQVAKRGAAVSAFATATHGDSPARAVKKRLSKSMENKLRELISAREDVVSCLKVRGVGLASLIVQSLLPDFDQTENRSVGAFADPTSVLCTACLAKLTHYRASSFVALADR